MWQQQLEANNNAESGDASGNDTAIADDDQPSPEKTRPSSPVKQESAKAQPTEKKDDTKL